jgi:rubredoxin
VYAHRSSTLRFASTCARSNDIQLTLLLLSSTQYRAIAEAAYRTVVLNGGKKQKSLTPGWKELGLEESAAQHIFDEQAKEGFVSEREAMYGGQTTKYDKKGRAIDKQGKLVNPEEADKDEEGDSNKGAIDNVYECGNCGFTLFVAKGRESKFFGDSFKCPECGASKKEFIALDDMDD